MTLTASSNMNATRRSDLPQMSLLPPGEFSMGESRQDRFANDTERPSHQVQMPQSVSVGVFPVTVAEFRAFRPGHSPRDGDDLPVVHVSWIDATAYCVWLSRQTGSNYRLLTEAEWEYACRAGSQTPFSFGEELKPAQANYLYDELGNSIGTGHRTPVGSYPANAFGLHDLHGNVCEWVADAWHPNYRGAPGSGRAWESETEPKRVIRGGAWDYLPRLLRCSWRDWRPADFRADNVGFRVAHPRPL